LRVASESEKKRGKESEDRTKRKKLGNGRIKEKP